MKKPKKKLNNGLIVMSRGERAGVISLLSVITVLLAFSVVRPALPVFKDEEHAFHNLDSMIALQERQARITTPSISKDYPTPASSPQSTSYSNPSSKPQRSSNPAHPVEPTASPKASSPTKAIPILDINVADSLVLVDLPQIGEVMASRIHRYRDRLGGFVSLEQLFEIKGMDSARFAAIKPYIVLENNEIKKLEVNRDEFKVLLRHPYLEYDQVKAVVNHRERKGLIKNWDQLQGITGEVNPLLEEYIVF